ncbi:MAG: 50S ribosomal protein L31e [Nanobdellota archaeon]
MADNTLTRTYTIPLRKSFFAVPKYRRAKRSISVIKKFLERHMKSDNIKLGKRLNEKIWERGIKNPPARVTVTAVKDKDSVVKAELEGHEYVDFKVKDKSPDKNASMKEKLQQKVESAKSSPSSESEDSSDAVKETKDKDSKKDSSTAKTASSAGKSSSGTKETSSSKSESKDGVKTSSADTVSSTKKSGKTTSSSKDLTSKKEDKKTSSSATKTNTN